MSKVTYLKIGALMKGKDGGFYIALDEAVETINGKSIAKNDQGKQYMSVEKPDVKFERMLAKGSITEEEFDEKVAKIPDFVRQEIQVKLEG